MSERTCTICGIVKPIDQFCKRGDKVRHQCKACDAKRKREHYAENYKEALIRQAKKRAEQKKVPFNLLPEHIKIPKKCPVLGIPIFRGKGKAIDNSPNIDRIIPERGYVANNVRVISAKANRIKSNATAEEIKLVWRDLLKIEKGKNEKE